MHSKKPFGSPTQVLKYLARYTHRVAISNHCLISLENGRVRFRYKDYQRGHKKRVMELSVVEFLRRFLLHVLPRRFMRIRYSGLLANPKRAGNLVRCRELLGLRTVIEPDDQSSEGLFDLQEAACCSQCGIGRMIIERLPPAWKRAAPRMRVPILDSS